MFLIDFPRRLLGASGPCGYSPKVPTAMTAISLCAPGEGKGTYLLR